ncbi:hypothetical protein OS493_007841 [Desmophyllum pertusum]|uniref:Apolipoprotein L3 n=1 Tax=Desmophyllum pertusum TaxID=174260 RepID=A0A9X0CM41_9CNID|nr:hypothetical protein OS493_007841 [Desmophyllum pertusum]
MEDYMPDLNASTPAETAQIKRELLDFNDNVTNMNKRKRDAAKEYRAAADYLDKVWKDCKIASAVGNGTGIVGGILTIVGGILTVLTLGAATPVLIAGIAVGAAGAGTNLGTAAIEAAINSSAVKRADEARERAQQATKKVYDAVQSWKSLKNKAHFTFLGYVAVEILELDTVALNIIQTVLKPAGISLVKSGETCANTTAEVTSKAVGKAGAKAGTKAGAKAAGGVIIGVSALFVVWDAVELGFTVRDLIQNKGSDAARSLREKAREIEATLS